MTSTVLAQITDELSTNLASDRELHLIKSAHRIIEKNLSINVLTDRNDVYYRYVHRLMNITFVSLEKNNADVRLAAEAYYEHILKAYECYGFPETSLKILAMSIERMNGARQFTKIIKYLVYYLDIIPKQRIPDKNGRTFHQEIVKVVILKSLNLNQTICHQALEKWCDKLISAVVWNEADLKEIAEKTIKKLWTTKGHASRTMAALIGAIMLQSKEVFRRSFYDHIDKVVESFVNNQPVPVGTISLIRKCFSEYAEKVPVQSSKELVEMLLLMIRDSSNEIAYDAFATLEEFVRKGCTRLHSFTPGSCLRSKYGCDTPDSDEADNCSELIDPLVNADLYEQLQETKPPKKVDLVLEPFEKIVANSEPSVEAYVSAFLGKTFLLTGIGNLVKTDRQSKDSMKILAIRVLNVICTSTHLETFVVRIAEKTQCLIDIVEYAKSQDDQLSQQAIKFAFIVLERGSQIKGCLDVFKSIKLHRYLHDAITLNHLNHLKESQLLKFLEIMAFRALTTTHYNLSIPDVASAARFMRVVKEWVSISEGPREEYVNVLRQFDDHLKKCILECWDQPRFVSIVPSLLSLSDNTPCNQDHLLPSLPLQIKIQPKKRVDFGKRANSLGPDIYDDWRTLMLAEVQMPTYVKMAAILKENISNPDLCYETTIQLSRMHWNGDTLPAVLQLMTVALTDEPSKDDCYHGFHVGMSVLNWIYRNVFIVKGSAETKEFPFLQHSRTEMDDALGNRSEFRNTLDAFYKSVQSSADEKLNQLIAPTVDLMMISMSRNFRTSTENVLEIIVYIKVLFTLSPVSALKLLHTLLRSLLDPKLLQSLSENELFYFKSRSRHHGKVMNDDETLVAALKCEGEKHFVRWSDDVDSEKFKSGLMTSDILQQLEPLITQSLKIFRNRGAEEKEQVIQIMICLMNHKLKLSDADPTECLMKFAVATFAKPKETPYPELFDSLMHFLMTACKCQKDEKYQKPLTAATIIIKSIRDLSPQNVKPAMKAIGISLSGKYELNECEELKRTGIAEWMYCMKHAPTETLYVLSLLLETDRKSISNQNLFWSVFVKWTELEELGTEKVPLCIMTLPLSLIAEYLTSTVNVFKTIEKWMDGNSSGNIEAKCALITTLHFCTENSRWNEYLNYVMAVGHQTDSVRLLERYAEKSLLLDGNEELENDNELMEETEDLIQELLIRNHCGSLQDLCHFVVNKGELSTIEFTELIEKERPNDDLLWRLLIIEFKRLEDDLEHRVDVSFRLQDLTDYLIETFNVNVLLKFFANIENTNLNFTSLKASHVRTLFGHVTTNCSESGYVLRGIRNLLAHQRMIQIIGEDELGTAQLYLKLAEKTTGIVVDEALLASYHQYRVDFQVKGEMEDSKIKEIKKFTFSLFVMCQETDLRTRKGLTTSQAACFRHPILNALFNIPLVAMKCFNWIPVVEIFRKPTIACLPPTGHVCDVLVLDDMRDRLAKVGLVTNAQFEVLFTTMQAVIAHTVIGPEKLDHDAKDVLERESRSCKALQLYIATILTSMKYPNGGDPSSGFVLKSPYISELFLQSSEFAHLCNLKSVWKCEPRTAFTTPIERHDSKTWIKFNGKTGLYGICQTPLFSLWQLCGMMPIEFKQHSNYHKVDHSASNYFLTSATNIDTISNVKQLMNIFEYWYSQGIGELSENLLHAILHTILQLSDFFDDPDLHKAVLRTTCIIYRHEYDQNPFLSSFVSLMFLKSMSVLGADMNGPEFKPGEPESISLKIVSSGLANDVKNVRLHTLAGLLYLVQSDTLESFSQTIDVLAGYLMKFLRKLANGSERVESDESQFVVALIVKLLEVPMRLKQDKKTLLKLLLASMRVRRERLIMELIAEGVEQLLCRSNEFNSEVTNFMLAGMETGNPIPFPTDNEYYCRISYRILMVAATRAKVANDDILLAKIYKALQKLGFEQLRRGETALAITRTLPFFSICVNGVENTIAQYMEAFVVDVSKEHNEFVTALLNQIIDTATTSKKWTVELKSVQEKMKEKSATLDVHNSWLLALLNSKLID